MCIFITMKQGRCAEGPKLMPRAENNTTLHYVSRIHLDVAPLNFEPTPPSPQTPYIMDAILFAALKLVPHITHLDATLLSKHPLLTIRIVKAYPTYPWDWTYLSLHPNITLKDIATNPHLPWNWTFVSSNPNLTREYVLQHLDKPWSWHRVSATLRITLENVRAHPELPWKFPWDANYHDRKPTPPLPLVPPITIQNVVNNPQIDWNWPRLTFHPNITLKDMQAHPELPWSTHNLSYNPNLTLEDVRTNPFRVTWDWNKVVQTVCINKQKEVRRCLGHAVRKWRLKRHLHRLSACAMALKRKGVNSKYLRGMVASFL